jgi:hypothetical protein
LLSKLLTFNKRNTPHTYFLFQINFGRGQISNISYKFLEEFYLLGYNVVKPVEGQPTFRRNMPLNLHGRRISKARNQREAGSKQSSGFLLGLFSDPEDGGDIFLRNVG